MKYGSPPAAGRVLEEQHGQAERGQVAERDGGDEVERGDQAAHDEREQDRDDDDRDREDAQQVGVGGPAYVVAGRRFTGNAVGAGAGIVGDGGDGGADGRHLAESRRSSPGRRCAGRRRIARSARQG